MTSVGRMFAINMILLFGVASEGFAQNRGGPNLHAIERVVEQGTQGRGQGTLASRRFELTLDDAIQRALDRNLDIAVERINPQVQDLTIVENLAFYKPTVGLNIDTSERKNPQQSALDGGRTTQTDSTTYNFNLSQAIKWGGGDFTLGFNNNRTESTNFFNSFNPSFRSVLQLNFTQPLLRGFRIDSARQQIRISRINREISDIDLRDTVINTVTDVKNAYWDLLYTVASVKVQQEALDLAEQLVLDNQAKVEIGTLAPLDVIQAQSEAAARRDTLAQARQALRTAELALKQLIVGGTEDELWVAELNPTDQPNLNHPPINIDQAVRIALEQRSDLERVQRQKNINDINVSGLRNNLLPDVSLTGSYQLQGQGGNLIERTGFFGGEIYKMTPGSYVDVLSQIFDNNFPTWTVGVQISYPIGDSAANAALARARLEVSQTEAQLRKLELTIATEVTNAALQIQSIQERVDASAASRDLAEQQLEAEESKFEVGMSTNFFVVQSQRDLSTARDAELRAILDYQKARIEFERVQRTSLSRAGISIVAGSAMGGGTGSGGIGSGGGGFGGF